MRWYTVIYMYAWEGFLFFFSFLFLFLVIFTGTPCLAQFTPLLLVRRISKNEEFVPSCWEHLTTFVFWSLQKKRISWQSRISEPECLYVWIMVFWSKRSNICQQGYCFLHCIRKLNTDCIGRVATNRDVIVFFELVMVLKTSCFKKKNNLADEEILMKSKVKRKL